MVLGFRKFISEVFVSGKFPKILPSKNFPLYGTVYFFHNNDLISYVYTNGYRNFLHWCDKCKVMVSRLLKIEHCIPYSRKISMIIKFAASWSSLLPQNLIPWNLIIASKCNNSWSSKFNLWNLSLSGNLKMFSLENYPLYGW